MLLSLTSPCCSPRHLYAALPLALALTWYTNMLAKHATHIPGPGGAGGASALGGGRGGAGLGLPITASQKRLSSASFLSTCAPVTCQDKQASHELMRPSSAPTMSASGPTQPSLLFPYSQLPVKRACKHACAARGEGAEASPSWKRMPRLSYAALATLPPEHTPLPRLRAPEDGGDRSAREQVGGG